MQLHTHIHQHGTIFRPLYGSTCVSWHAQKWRIFIHQCSTVKRGGCFQQHLVVCGFVCVCNCIYRNTFILQLQ